MSKCRQVGFTLIEVIVFIVVVSIGLAGILLVSTTSVKNSSDPLVHKQAIAIAESLLEEIVLKEFKDPNGGPNGVSACTKASGSDRALWLSVCDYNGYFSSGIYDVLGNPVAALSGYSVTAVSVADEPTLASKKITVTVNGPGGPVSLTGYRGNY